MRHLLAIGFVVCFVFSLGMAQNQSESDSSVTDVIKTQRVGDFDAKDIAAANTLVETLHIADWLGPMARLRLSPFFGMAALSGLALYGPEWITDNALLSASGPLKNEALFVVFLILTVMTSLPRLSKVSKPLAQAADQLETYSVIVVLLAIKFMSNTGNPDPAPVAMVQLGVISMTGDLLLSLAMIVNIIVINSVKFFFEFMVWLTPVPALDAIFEICNKGLCAFLMAIYAFSPTIATIINLVILLVAAVMFRWMNRRVGFYRTMVIDPILSRIWPSYGSPKRPEIVVFPRDAVGPFAAKSRLKLARRDDGWELTQCNWFMPSTSHPILADANPMVSHGWVMHSVDLMCDGDVKSLIFSRRYDNVLADLARQLSIKLPDREEPAGANSTESLAGEFA